MLAIEASFYAYVICMNMIIKILTFFFPIQTKLPTINNHKIVNSSYFSMPKKKGRYIRVAQ